MSDLHDWHSPDRQSVYCRRCDVRAGSAAASIRCGEDCHTSPVTSQPSPTPANHTTMKEQQQ